jgi:GNAT superfamily N-acetyltransferase
MQRRLNVRPLSPEDWAVIEALFGDRGACGGCWCMYWRSPFGGQKFKARLGETNRKDFRALVEAGSVHGVLAFDGDRPVGWCSIGPREDFPYLERSRVLKTDWKPGTWSVTCFFIPAGERGRGVAAALLDGAVKLARKRGAKEIEGYPVRVRPDGARLAAAFAWTGVPALFENGGFEPLERDEDRVVYRRRLK